ARGAPRPKHEVPEPAQRDRARREDRERSVCGMTAALVLCAHSRASRGDPMSLQAESRRPWYTRPIASAFVAAVTLSACATGSIDGTQPSTETTPPPPDRPGATKQGHAEFAASKATIEATGITTWFVQVRPGGSFVFEGHTAAGTSKLRLETG